MADKTNRKMEVEIKKVKVTKGLLAQVQYASKAQLNRMTVLGWYIEKVKVGSRRTILLGDGRDLAKLPLFVDIKQELKQNREDYMKQDFVVGIETSVGYSEYRFSDKIDADKFVETLKQVKSAALGIGQIYY